jgi:hypothetical protein
LRRGEQKETEQDCEAAKHFHEGNLVLCGTAF